MIPFHLIHIIGKQVVRGCLPIENKDGCFDPIEINDKVQKELEQAGQAVDQSLQAAGEAIGGAFGINRREASANAETCICKKDLCNSSPPATTSSLLTIIVVVFLKNL